MHPRLGGQFDTMSPPSAAHIDYCSAYAYSDDDMFELHLSPSPGPSPSELLERPRTPVGTSADMRHHRAAERVGRPLRIFAFGRCTMYAPASSAAPNLRPITLVEAFGDYTLRMTEGPLPDSYLRLCPTVTGVTSLALAVLFGANAIAEQSAPQQILAEANAFAAELTGQIEISRRSSWSSAYAVHQPLQWPGQ